MITLRALKRQKFQSALGYIMEKNFDTKLDPNIEPTPPETHFNTIRSTSIFEVGLWNFCRFLPYENACLNQNYSEVLKSSTTLFSGLLQHKPFYWTLSTCPPTDVPLSRGSPLKKPHSPKFTALRRHCVRNLKAFCVSVTVNFWREWNILSWRHRTSGVVC